MAPFSRKFSLINQFLFQAWVFRKHFPSALLFLTTTNIASRCITFFPPLSALPPNPLQRQTPPPSSKSEEQPERRRFFAQVRHTFQLTFMHLLKEMSPLSLSLPRFPIVDMPRRRRNFQGKQPPEQPRSPARQAQSVLGRICTYDRDGEKDGV